MRSWKGRARGNEEMAHIPVKNPISWIISVLQTVHMSHGRLLPSAVYLHKRNSVEAVLMFGGEFRRIIVAVELIRLAVRDGNLLLAIF
jgi:hypothetical protein